MNPIKSTLVFVAISALMIGPGEMAPRAPATSHAATEQAQAPGEPYEAPFDCKRAGPIIERLTAGLPVQEEAMRRTAALIESARNESLALDAKARARMLEGAADAIKSLASDLVSTTKALRNRLHGLERAGLSQEQRKAWLKRMKELEDLGDSLKASPTSFKAGYDFGNELQGRAHTAKQLVAEVRKLAVDSGIADAIADEAGDKLSKIVGGPLGALAFRATRIAIDVGILRASRALSEAEYQEAWANYNVMRNEYYRSKDTIANLQSGLARHCNQEAKADKQKKKPSTKPGKSGGGVGTAVMIGGVVAAGAALAAAIPVLTPQQTESGGTTGACISSRNCIVSVLGNPCSCAGTVNGPCNWTGPVAREGQACASGVPCAQGLSCNNGRCEGRGGRCPF